MKFLFLTLFAVTLDARALTCQFRSHEALGRAVLEQVQDLNCGARKKVHLTFDDGPHADYTPLLLRELAMRRVRSTFFVSTTNISPGRVTQRQIVSKIMDEGHAVGSHGHRHEAYDLRMDAKGEKVSETLTPREQEEEIRLSKTYLNQATANRYSRQTPLLFRFPYGRGALPSDTELDALERRGKMRFSAEDRPTRLKEYRRLSSPLHNIAEAGHGHLLWNHDSQDSSSSAPSNTPESKASFVAKNLRGLCTSPQTDIVSLFHDIKSFNPEVIAVLIDIGQCLGISFVDSRTILQSQALLSSATYIPQERIQSAPVERLDSIAEFLKTLGPDCEEEKEPTPGSCFSESLNRHFGDCEAGTVSICIRGSWYQKTDQKLQECRARGL